MVGYVGDSDLGPRLVLKWVQDDEPHRPPHMVVLRANDLPWSMHAQLCDSPDLQYITVKKSTYSELIKEC